jgi:hypothetical protein
MSFIYPRTVAISRPNTTTTAGVQPFQDGTPAQETSVATGLPASIQVDHDGGKPLANVALDARASGTWRIFIPQGAASIAGVGTPETIRDTDIITDDAGVRYQVVHPYWNSLGWQLRCERLKA